MGLLGYSEYKIPRESQIFQYLSLDPNGDQSLVNINAVGAYSIGSPGDFCIIPPANELWVIFRMIVYIEAAGVFKAEGYGPSLGNLPNGVLVLRNKTGDVSDYLVTTKSIKHNAEWGQYNYDVDLKDWGNGNKVLLARWTFEKSGRAMTLDGSDGEKLIVRCRDDHSNLDEHFFHVQGFKILI